MTESEALPSVFESYVRALKSSLRIPYELTMDKDSVPLEFFEGRALELILAVKSGNPLIADELLEMIPSLKKKVASAGGLDLVKRNGKIGPKGYYNQRLGGYEHSKVLFENLNESARQNPALVREKLLEEFGDPKDFQGFLYAISASEQSCPGVSQIAWDVAKELVRKQEAAYKSAAMAKQLLDYYLHSHRRVEPGLIEFGFAVMDRVGERSAQRSARNDLEQTIIGQWAIIDLKSAMRHLDAIPGAFFRLQSLLSMVKAYDTVSPPWASRPAGQ